MMTPYDTRCLRQRAYDLYYAARLGLAMGIVCFLLCAELMVFNSLNAMRWWVFPLAGAGILCGLASFAASKQRDRIVKLLEDEGYGKR